MALKEKRINKLLIPLVVVLTLGLAPYQPEPHIVGKIRWVMGGAVGMGTMDYLDLALHGLPWLFLLYMIFKVFFLDKRKSQSQE